MLREWTERYRLKRDQSTITAGLLIVLGVVLRLAAYLSNRALWGDEVSIALNLRFRDFRGLFQPLDYEQTMPIPLLVGIKSAVSVLGFSEYALRLLPLIAGCIFLVALWVTFAHFFGRAIALIALGLAVAWKPLIYYSSELKQYECDALITMVTLWFAFWLIERKDSSGWPALIIWGGIAILLSQPAVFLLAAVGLGAVLDRRTTHSKKWARYCFTAAFCWLIEFASLFMFSYRYTSASTYMRSFWADNFLDPRTGRFGERLLSALWIAMGVRSFIHIRALVLAALALAGLYGIWRVRGLQGITIAAGPFVLLFGAAVLKQYPIADRLIFFTLPLLFWIYASGVTTIAALMPNRFRPVTSVLLALVIIGPMIVSSIQYVRQFPPREATRQILAWMNATDRRAPVYLAFARYTQWAYYAGDWSRPAVLKQKIDRVSSCKFCTGIVYTGSGGQRTEIIGTQPASQSNTVADEQWASQEASRIAATNTEHVWIFVPIYNEQYRQRRLLKMLSDKLQERHADLTNKFCLGETIALRYALRPI